MRPGSRPAGRSAAPANGYSLVMVVMLITVMNIVVAIALPLWSGMIRRDKEEELISRGLQYAEAIRVFQRRFGRLPVQLDELIKVEPRSIRRLWEDPMTGKADWELIFEGAPPGAPPIDPATGQPIPGGTGVPQSPSGSPDDENAPQPIGPIRGVRSRADGEGFHLFLDQASYSSWEFRSDLFSRFRTAPTENGIPRVSALTLGRPFRFALPAGAQNPGGNRPPNAGPAGSGGSGLPGDPRIPPAPRPQLRPRPPHPQPGDKP